MVKQDYSYSLDKDSNLIHVENAVKGNEYYCPCCREIMIPKQGKINKWHFAHKGNLGKCSYETYLHTIAKKRICECFNNSQIFKISFHPKAICNIQECPLGVKEPCSWKTKKTFDLKEYYNKCEEEVKINNFRADLLITNTEKNVPPILIEIYVSHKSTEQKINSNLHIIEIRIKSEEDLNQIVSAASIQESEGYIDELMTKPNEKIKFYNFKGETEKPDESHQSERFTFWIDGRGYFKCDSLDDYDYSSKCLSPRPLEIERSIFRIESRFPIGWDFAFYKLSESGLGFKYCPMCDHYRYNEFLERFLCILYKSKGTNKFPRLSEAQNCPHFKQVKYNTNDYVPDPEFECRITVRKD